MEKKYLERFKSLFKEGRKKECWEWNGHLNNDYGRIWIGSYEEYAHRISYEYYVGEIKNGLYIDHKCRNPKCVNPNHLRLVTHVENVLLGISPPAVNKRKTHCKEGHKFTKKNTAIVNHGKSRLCRTCHSINCKAYRDYRKKLDPHYQAKYTRKWREKLKNERTNKPSDS